jgi:TolA-binding protein
MLLMKTIDFSYFIERFNAGEMNQTEKSWFEKELEGNDALRKEVALRKRVDNGLLQHDLISLRNKLVNLERERKEQVIASSGKKTAGIRYAAAIAGFLVIGSITLITLQNQNSDEFINNSLARFKSQGTSRTVTSAGDLSYEKALSFFESNDFIRAAVLFDEYLSKNPGNMEVQFLNGVSEMKNSNYPDAKLSFSTVINNNNNLFIDNAKYGLAMCLVKTNEIEKAKHLLIQIRDSESTHSREAKQLLRKL